MEIAADGSAWTYYLRKGLKFHNGVQITAKDVKFSLERYLSKDSMYAYLRDAVSQVDIIDDYTVKLTTKGVQPYLPFITGVNYQGGIIIPKDYF